MSEMQGFRAAFPGDFAVPVLTVPGGPCPLDPSCQEVFTHRPEAARFCSAWRHAHPPAAARRNGGPASAPAAVTPEPAVTAAAVTAAPVATAAVTDRPCRHCGGPMPPEKRATAAYCRDACRVAAHRRIGEPA